MINSVYDLQRKLDITRDRARYLGKQVIEILKAGFYETVKGNRIEIMNL